jgi:hypothetical protein
MSNGVAFKIIGTGGVTVESVVEGPPMLNMALWYIADNISGVDGDPVAVLPDSSGNNRPATQSDSSKQPVLKTGANGINGHSVFRTSDPMGLLAGASFLSLTIDPSVYAGLSVYYVARTASTLVAYGSIVGWAVNNSSGFNVALGTEPTRGAGWSGSTGAVDLGPVNGIAADTVFYGSYRYDKTQWVIDGPNNGVVSDTSFPIGIENLLVGSGVYPGTQSLADIAEIIIFSAALSDEDDATIKAYLQAKYALQSTMPVPVIDVGYPDTLINNFAVRYVHPAGNDANDGKRWETAKATILAAYDDLADLPPPGDQSPGLGTIYIHDGCYVGGEVPSQGIWLYGEDTYPGAGWRQFRPTRFIGVGGGPPLSFGPAKARIFPGMQGDDPSWDLTKPLIWVYGMENELLFKNLEPAAAYGFARIAVKADGSRDGLVSNLTLDGVTMISPPDTAPSFGPCYDCGWTNISWFKRCGAVGSSTSLPVVVDPTDNVVGATRTWTFANAAFTSDYVGGWFDFGGAANPANDGQFYITTVIDAHTVVTTDATSPVDETFSGAGKTLQVVFGPTVLADDDHAGWLFRPNIDGSGNVGSVGQVYFDEVYPQHCGIKYYVGNTGYGLTVSNFLSEGGPLPYPINIAVIPGTNLGDVFPTFSRLVLDSIEIADAETLGPYLVYFDPILLPRLNPETISAKGIEGCIFGPAKVFGNNDTYNEGLPSSPWRRGQVGIFKDGRLSAKTDAGRRLGAPGTALPTATSNTASTNLISHDPTVYTANGGATLTPNTLDLFGGHNACDMAANVGSIGFGAATMTLSDGDLVVAGIWARAPGAFRLDSPILEIAAVPGLFSNLGGNIQFANGFWAGNGEWQWGSNAGVYQTPSGSPVSCTITLTSPASHYGSSRFCYPVLLILKTSDGWTDTEAWELMAHMATWNPELGQGVVGTLRNQPFVGHGGLGIASSLPRTVGAGSGQLTLGSVLSYEPRFAEDGTTIIGWVPIYAATVNP